VSKACLPPLLRLAEAGGIVLTLPWGAPVRSSLLLSRLVKMAHPVNRARVRPLAAEACARRILGGKGLGANLRPGGGSVGRDPGSPYAAAESEDGLQGGSRDALLKGRTSACCEPLCLIRGHEAFR
jgi:hypothetical protein